MIDSPALRQLRQQWRDNPRLRYGGLVIVAILGVQGLLMLSDAVGKRVAAYTGDLEMQARLQGVRSETWWPQRADKARAELEAVNARIPGVAGKGMARAESQAWLAKLAADQQLGEPAIKVEDTVEVDGYPDLWQVIAQLEGQLPEYGQEPLLHALADARPWVQAERIEISQGSTPRVVVTLRSYYRKAAAADAPPQPAPATAEVAQ